jgi:membrane associated rhomboid family serine protease
MIGAMIELFLFLLFIILTLFVNSIEFPMPFTDTGTVRYSSIPVMTLMIILVNSLVFLLFQAPALYQGSIQLQGGDQMSGLHMLYDYVVQVWTFGYRDVFVHQGVGIGALAAFTSMFMHADMWHLIGNMIFLWTFGRRVEDACGAWRYLLFYLMAGVIANIGFDLLNNPQMDIPGIGASGAIAGVMGAYLILFPGTLIRCFWGIGIILRVPTVIVLKLTSKSRSFQTAPLFRWTIDLPAWTFLIVWLAINTLPSIQVIEQGSDLGGVNTLAHVTGFLGSLFIFLFVKKDMVTRYFSGRTI